MSILQFTGSHKPVDQMTPDEEWDEIVRLNKEVQDLLREVGRWGRKEERAQNFLRYRFNVASHRDLTIGDMRRAIPMLRKTVRECQQFSERMHEISDAFDTEVVGRGVPWTPWIKRKLGQRRAHQIGGNPDWEALLMELKGEIKAAAGNQEK